MERVGITLDLSLALLILGSAGTLYYSGSQLTSAQMMTSPNMTDTNTTEMTNLNMMPHLKGENVTGSIDLMSIISNAIGSQVNVTLSEAASSAEKHVGNDSHAVVASIGEENGYLVYNVCVFDPNGKIHKIIIDPANGSILLSRELSEIELMMIHQGIMMGRGMMDNGMMMGRGMMDNGMMMGRGMMQGWETIK
jgi:uncharacterized membrane protein YkoI